MAPPAWSPGARVGRGPVAERRATRRSGAQAGQAELELLAAIPLLLGLALLVLQLMAVGYAQTLADGSAEAGALAVGAGLEPGPAARGALPGWADDRVEVEAEGGRVAVALRPPALLPALGDRLEVSASAWVRPGGA